MSKLTLTIDINGGDVTFLARNEETGSEWVPPYASVTVWTPQGNELQVASHPRVSDAKRQFKTKKEQTQDA